MDTSFIEFLFLSVFSFIGDGSTASTAVVLFDRLDIILQKCPEHAHTMDLNELKKIRYHNGTKRCYRLKSEGPCGNNMEFYAEDDIYGGCECQDDDRLLIYHQRSKQCYHIFQKGYCNKNQWLDLTRQGRAICSRNPCAALTRISGKDLVLFNGMCSEVGKSATGCPQGEVVGFFKNKRLPVCVSSRSLPISDRSLGVPQAPCNVGSVMAFNGICNPPFDFD